MVVLCIVLLDYVVYPIVRRRTGRPVTSLSKMTAGMFCMAIGFFVTGFLQLKIDAAPRAWVAACTPAVAITLVCALWAGGGGGSAANSVWIGWQAPQVRRRVCLVGCAGPALTVR